MKSTHKYFIYRGLEKIEIEADSVGLITADGHELELQCRSDGEISLSAYKGSLIIIPRSSNLIHVTTDRGKKSTYSSKS